MRIYVRIVLFLATTLTVSEISFCQDTLWVNSGQWYQSADTMTVLRLNTSSEFDTTSVALSASENLPSEFIIINSDVVEHEFSIEGLNDFFVTLPVNEPTEVNLPALSMGTYRFYSNTLRGAYMGLSGVLKVGLDAPIQYHWNLADWMPSRVDSVATFAPIDFDGGYVPKYFSINSKTYPNTNQDPFGNIELSLGDTCTISIVNGGFMDHVLHFHGFHVLWLSSTVQTSRIGWTKDTVPIHRGEGLTLQLVAEQLGVYPVHNHNLIAVTNAGFYPGGMLTMITVTP